MSIINIYESLAELQDKIQSLASEYGVEIEPLFRYTSDGKLQGVRFDIDARKISYKERNSPKTYFLDPKRKSFPIINCTDVKAAPSAWGRYKGSMSFDEFKSKLTRRAKQLGCESSLPDKWKNESD